MSKVTVVANSAPKIDEQLQSLAKHWEEEGKWWLKKDYTENLQWCFENRVAIMALHSCEEQTPIFQLYGTIHYITHLLTKLMTARECIGCQRWYKHCMFSNRERKSDYPVSYFPFPRTILVTSSPSPLILLFFNFSNSMLTSDSLDVSLVPS
jgi:hypothetical protein